MIIDIHYHFWKNIAFWDAWIEQSMSVIRKDFLPTALESLLNNMWLMKKFMT